MENETSNKLKSKVNWWKVAVYVIGIVSLLAIGFFVGRKTIEQPEPDIVYVPGDTVKIEIEKPKPIKEVVDTANIIKDCVKNGIFYDLFPEKIRDSVVYVTLTKEDTAKVFNDWATSRTYSELLFDVDTLGKATFNANVQFNRLMSFDYEFVPMEKQVTVVQPKPKYSPFVAFGVSTLPSLNAMVGAFHDDKWGGAFTYQYDYLSNKHIIGSMFLIKF